MEERRTEELRVGDKILGSKHQVLVGGSVTVIEPKVKDIWGVSVVGGDNINAKGKIRILIKGSEKHSIERE